MQVYDDSTLRGINERLTKMHVPFKVLSPNYISGKFDGVFLNDSIYIAITDDHILTFENKKFSYYSIFEENVKSYKLKFVLAESL